MLTFLIFVTLPILVIFVYLRYQSASKRIGQLAKEGIESEAIVDKLSAIGDTGNNTQHDHYLVDYGYDVEGKHYNHCAEISKTEFKNLKEGEKIRIAFLKENPAISHPNYGSKKTKYASSQKWLN